MKKLLSRAILSCCLIFLVFSGCSRGSSPKATVLDFLKAVRAKDGAKIQNSLSFERLLTEKDGDSYTKLAPDAKKKALDNFREGMVNQLMNGQLNFLGDIDPKVEKENESGETAEVIISNTRNQKMTLSFGLVREGGVWKIYTISGR